MKPKVSIITPTYNHEDYIEKCIRSVLAQSYRNWEMIIIDDDSSDKTYDLALKIKKSDNRIKLIKHRIRWGIKKLDVTYNQALRISRGELIAILEGDDYWPKDKLKQQIKVFRYNDIVMSFGDCIVVNRHGHPLEVNTYRNGRNRFQNSPIGSIISQFYDLDFYISPVTVMIRKSTLNKIGGFKKNKYYRFVDIPTIIELGLTGKFNYINNILGFYRKHEQSSWFNYAKETTTMGRKEFVNYLRVFIKRKRKTLLKNFPEFFDEESLKKQNLMLGQKKREKEISLIRHYLAFGEVNRAKTMSKKAIQNHDLTLRDKLFLYIVLLGVFNNRLSIRLIGEFLVLRYRFMCFIHTRINEFIST